MCIQWTTKSNHMHARKHTLAHINTAHKLFHILLVCIFFFLSSIVGEPPSPLFKLGCLNIYTFDYCTYIQSLELESGSMQSFHRESSICVFNGCVQAQYWMYVICIWQCSEPNKQSHTQIKLKKIDLKHKNASGHVYVHLAWVKREPLHVLYCLEQKRICPGRHARWQSKKRSWKYLLKINCPRRK